jgi:hypothetical protein
MRVPAVSSAIGLVLIAATATACSSGSSTAADAASVSTPSASTSVASTSSAAAAGSSSSSGGGGAADINACSLLTVRQATSLGGWPYTAAKPQTIATGQDLCSYANSGPSVSLLVTVYQPDSGVTMAALTTQLSGAGKVTKVNGVGDQAISSFGGVAAQVGDRYISVFGAKENSGNISIAKVVAAGLR